MQIVKNMGSKNKREKVTFNKSLGHLGSIRLLGFEFFEDNSSKLWKAKLLTKHNKIEYKELKFVRKYDFHTLSKKIDIYILDTESGDVKLTDFKALSTNSILETIPQELITYIDAIT